MRKTVFLVVATSLLTACFPDDPDNIPLKGSWDMTTRIDSLTIDGTIVPRDALPAEIANLEQTGNRCGEPVFTDREAEQNVLDWRAGGACTFETFDANGARVDIAGACQRVGGIESFNPRFDVGITQREADYRMLINMEGSADIPGQGTHYIRLVAVQEGSRTGDC